MTFPEPANTKFLARPRSKARSLDEYLVRAIQLARAWKDQIWSRPPKIKAGPDQLPRGFATDLVAAYKSASCERMPHAIRAAEDLLAGRLFVFGHKLQLDMPIPWHRDFIHGKTAPHVFWRKVPVHDAARIGDSKVIWELNRLQFLLPVAKAFFLTGDRRFYRWVRSTLMDWYVSNPYPQGINWSSSLELAFRCVTIDWVVRFCGNEIRRDREFCQVIYTLLAAHGRHIARFLSTYFSPNTHLTGEALALYLLGTRYGFLPSAQNWRNIGRQILFRCADVHILSDGGYYERSTWYHRYTTEIYLLFSVLADEVNEALPGSIRTKIAQLGMFLLHSCRDDGTFPIIGDDDGGRLIALDDDSADDIRGLLALLAAYLTRTDFKFVGGSRDEAIWWLLGKNAAHDYSHLQLKRPAASAAVFAETGYAFLRNSWSTLGPTTHLSFDAGPHGVANCGHAHADALSITLSIGSEHVVVDPGTYSYSIDWKQRNNLRGEEAHSGVLIADRPKHIPDTRPFQWAQVGASARLDYWFFGEMYDCLQGTNVISLGASEIQHSRKLFFAKDQQFVLVWDTVTGLGSCEASIQFILAGTNWNADEGRVQMQLASGKHFIIQPICLTSACAVSTAEMLTSPRYLETINGCRLQFRRRLTPLETHITLMAWGDTPRRLTPCSFDRTSIQLSENDQRIWCHIGMPSETANDIQSDAAAYMILMQNERLSLAEAHAVSVLAFQQSQLIDELEQIPHWRIRRQQ